MKIKINESEIYMITIPEEVNANQLFTIISRLNTIGKLIGRDPMSMPVPINNISTKRHYKPRDALTSSNFFSFIQSREEALKVLIIHYHGTATQKYELAKKYGRKWTAIMKRFAYTKAKWNIQPKEVGLTDFKGRGRTLATDPYFTLPPNILKELMQMPNVIKERIVTKGPEVNGAQTSRLHKRKLPSTVRTFNTNREEALDVVKTHYFGTEQEKEEIANRYKARWEVLAGGMHALIKRWNFTPEEVGLAQFPTREHKRVHPLK